MRTKKTITAVLTKRCTRKCHYCIGDCHLDKWANTPDMEFDALLIWCSKYAPNCNLHLSGGEPLLFEDIASNTKKALDAGHSVSIFTNGDLLKSDHKLLSMDVMWHLTHHLPKTTGDFLKKAELVKYKPHIVTRLKTGHEALNETDRVADQYSGLNFHWSIPRKGRELDGFVLRPEDSGRIASDVINLIEVDGQVYPCSTKKRHGAIGNIYEGTYDTGGLEELNKHCDWCVKNNCCSAYQSAVLMGA